MTPIGDEPQQLFIEAVEMLGRSLERLDGHRRALQPIMPLDAERLEQLGDPELTRIEARLKKFDQTVDDLRRRAFRGVLILSAEPVEGMSVRQMLERLATLGAIPSAEDFVRILNLRNRLAHEYPRQPDRQADLVTAAWRTIPELLSLLDGIRRYAVEAGLVSAADLPPPPRP